MQSRKWSLTRPSPSRGVPVQADRPQSPPRPPFPSCPPSSNPPAGAPSLPLPCLLALGSVPPLPPFCFTPPSASCAALSAPLARVGRVRWRRFMTWAVRLARPLVAVSWGGTEEGRDGGRGRREAAKRGEGYYPVAADHRGCLGRRRRHRCRLCFRRRCCHRRREPTLRLRRQGRPVWGRLRTLDAATILTHTPSLTCLLGVACPLSLSLVPFTPLSPSNPIPFPLLPPPPPSSPSRDDPPPHSSRYFLIHLGSYPAFVPAPVYSFPGPSSVCRCCHFRPPAGLWVKNAREAPAVVFTRSGGCSDSGGGCGSGGSSGCGARLPAPRRVRAQGRPAGARGRGETERGGCSGGGGAGHRGGTV